MSLDISIVVIVTVIVYKSMKNLLYLPLIFLLFLSLKNGVDISSEPQESEYYFVRRMPTREEVLVAAFKEELPEAKQLLFHESGINPTAVNPTSGACGVPQALPCSKMGCELSHDIEDFTCQINWAKKYIEQRYGSASQALEFWHAQSPHWY